MTSITNTIVNIFTPKGFEGLMEFLVVMLQIVYILFAFIVTRQVSLMNKSFHTPIAGGLKLLASLHFFASVGIVIISIILL